MLDIVHDDRTEQLKDAFHAFNELSQNLSASYQDLEARVARLTEELAVAHDARFATLMEKEQFASRLQLLLEALPGAIIVIDRNNIIVEHNRGAVEFLARPLLGQSWESVVQRSMKNAGNNPHERTLKDGRVVSVLSRRVNDKPESERIILMTDLSETRALEELAHHQKRLSAMGEMVASMAHQVRTPLSSAILYASQLSDSKLNEPQRLKFSKKILDRLHHLESQVNDMLVFARNGQLSMEKISVDSILEKLRELAEGHIDTDSIRFTIDNYSTGSFFRGNADSLLGALMNLVSNALSVLKGTDNGLIRLVVVVTSDSKIRFTLIDNGPGISGELQKRVFEPFFTTRNHGTGLGLAVVESIICAHKGRVWCKSEQGKGARFHIELPIDEKKVLLSSGSPLHEMMKQA